MESLDQQQFQHFIHWHPLKLTQMEDDNKNLCYVCLEHCSGRTYICCNSECYFFLHESCFNLPQKIHHPFHPQHPLTLRFIQFPINLEECKVCHRFCSRFAYSCIACRFHMHLECPVLISTIKYQGHHHNIVFVDGLDPCQIDAEGDDDSISGSVAKPHLLCSACGKICKHKTAMFHCVQCSFHLHFQCGPLPCFLKHEDHLCSLKLTDSPVIVEGEDKDTDVFYCDACEKERDPRLPVYYCSNGCAYLVEIKCVISQVLPSLRGDYGEVEVRSGIFKNRTGKVICKLRGMLKGTELAWKDSVEEGDTEVGKLEVDDRSITLVALQIQMENIRKKKVMQMEREAKKSVAKEIEMKIEYTHAQKNKQDGHDCWLTSTEEFGYSDEDCRNFISLMNSFDHAKTIKEFYENRMVVDHGHLSVILEDLCPKHGDIIPRSYSDGSRFSNVLVIILCETIRGMCTTRVADLSEADLFLWWRCLKILQDSDFKVEFALNRLKRVGNAYYALQVERTVKEDCEQMDKEIKELEEKLMALKERRKRRTPQKPASSSIVAECFREASVLKWMMVGDGLM